MKKILTLAFLIFIVVACVEKKAPVPKDLLDQNTFIAVMIDVQLAGGKATQNSYVRGDEITPPVNLYPHIFEKYQVDPNKFLKTYYYYTAHPAKMEKIYAHVLDSLTKLDVVIKRKYEATARAANDSLREANRRRRDSSRVFRGLK